MRDQARRSSSQGAPAIYGSRNTDQVAPLRSRWSALGLLALACFGCSDAQPETLAELVQKTTPSKLKILVVGIDGGSFAVIDPMIAAGGLPAMTRLMENGTRGPLRSVSPSRSPSIWTTIATGRAAKDHGVQSFTRPSDESRLITSNERSVNALWNWASAFDKRVGFNGWWVTWPAEPVQGWMVSDRITRSRWSEWLDGDVAQNLTHPSNLASELLPLLVDPAKPPMDEIAAMADFSEAELASLAAAEEPIFGDRLSVFKFAYCAQRSYENIALHMLEKEQPDLMGVFLIANDSICHTHWQFHEPEAFEGIDPAEAARLGKLIPSIQEHNDRYLEKLLSKVDEDTIVFVVSDHGFQASGVLTESIKAKDYKSARAEAEKIGQLALMQPGMHHLDGIFMARGPYIKQGFQLKASVYDLAPTILALMGLPVADNLEGRVLTEMIEPAFFEKHPLTTIDSYDRLLGRTLIPLPEDGDDDAGMDQIKALGYVDPSDEEEDE